MTHISGRTAIPALVLALGALLAVPTSATPPGQNGRIVWQREPTGDGLPHLFVANQDGSGAQRVFAVRNRGDAEGTFSPTDPDVMFFTRFVPRPFGDDLYTGNLATGDVSEVITTKHAELAATVSPDGTKIVYFRVTRSPFDADAPPPPTRIRVANIDGSGDHVITPRRELIADPDWSPDGSQIVYMQLRFADDVPQERIVVINADGSGRRALTRFGGVNERNPKWMPDGETIVFERFRETGKLSDIATVDVSGGTQQTMLATKYWDTNPIPSPDGTRILFTSNRDRPGAENRLGRGFELYTMALDGSDMVRLTNNRRPDIFPDWQRLP
jgi:Tol biopolymer transport system component